MAEKNTALQTQIDTSRTDEALQKEAALRFGPNVRVEFNPAFPIDKLQAPDDFNIRISEGQSVGGFKIQSDHRNIVGMMQDIEQLGGIQVPLVASERGDGTVIVCQGYRRYNAASRIRRDNPGSELSTRLAGIPVLVYSGLTPEQERSLVNDQTSKAFTKTEVYRRFCEQLAGGHSWLNIAERDYPQIARVMGNESKAKEIDAISDPKEKKEALRQWLLSSVFQGWVNGTQCGPRVASYWLQTMLWSDRYKGVPRPPVVMDTMRQRKITAEVKKDQIASEWNAKEGTGTRTNALLAKLEAEDLKRFDAEGNRVQQASDPNAVKLRPGSEVKDIIDREEQETGKPTLLSRVVRVSLKDGGDTEAFRIVRAHGAILEAYQTHRAYIGASLRGILDTALDSLDGSAERFSALLADNYATTLASVEPEAEETPSADGSFPLPGAETSTVSENAGESVKGEGKSKKTKKK